MAIVGATSEVVTLKQALVEAEKRAATERTEQEKYEAEVGKVRQELQALMEKHESLELDSKTRASELAVAIENAKSAKAESQKTLQELDEVKEIAAGKAFFMQSKHVNMSYLLLTRIWSSQEHSQIFPVACPMPPHSIEPRRVARQRRCSGLSMLRPDTPCP